MNQEKSKKWLISQFLKIKITRFFYAKLPTYLKSSLVIWSPQGLTSG